MWGGDGGGSKKRVFLSCKKHAFSGSEEELKKLPADAKKKNFFEGGSEKELKKMPADPEQEMWEGDGGGFKSVFF